MFKNVQECDQDETCHGLRQAVKKTNTGVSEMEM